MNKPQLFSNFLLLVSVISLGAASRATPLVLYRNWDASYGALIQPTFISRRMDRSDVEITLKTIKIYRKEGSAWDLSNDSIDIHRVTSPSSLNLLGRPDLAEFWHRSAQENLSYYRFAQRLMVLTSQYGPVWTFPVAAARELQNSVNFATSLDDLTYAASVITLNMKDSAASPGQGLLNLAFLMALQRSKIHLTADLLRSLAEPNGPATIRWTTLLPSSAANDSPDPQAWSTLLHHLQTSHLSVEEKRRMGHSLRRVLNDVFQRPRLSYVSHSEKRANGIYKTLFVLLKDYERFFPSELFTFPGSFIELLPDPESRTGSHDRDIVGSVPNPLFGDPTVPSYWNGKARNLVLPNGTALLVKRVDPLRVRYPSEEIRTARRVDQALHQLGGGLKVQRYVGLIYDEGSFYLLSEAAALIQPYDIAVDPEIFRVIARVVRRNTVPVIADSRRRMWLDFESFPYQESTNSQSDSHSEPQSLRSSL